MKVLNFGSLNIDYVYDVAHCVRPGETITSLGRSIFAGGKGLNQSVALAKAGAEVYHAGKVGYDGEILFKAMEQAGVNARYVVRQEEMQSGHTIIQVDAEGQNCIIVHGGTNRTLTHAQMDQTLEGFAQGDFLVLQNEINDLPYLIERAHEKGMNIVLNPSPMDELIDALPLEKVDYLIVNEIEGAQIAGTETIGEIIPALAQKYPGMKVLLTLGSDGAVYFDGQTTYSQPIFKVKAVDTTAAGDTFLGYFVSGIGSGVPVETVLRRAARASSITVSGKGAAESIPRLEEVIAKEND